MFHVKHSCLFLNLRLHFYRFLRFFLLHTKKADRISRYPVRTIFNAAFYSVTGAVSGIGSGRASGTVATASGAVVSN